MEDGEVSIKMPFGTDISNLVANFSTDASVVSVKGVRQISGVSALDFSSPASASGIFARRPPRRGSIITIGISLLSSDMPFIRHFFRSFFT